MKSRYVEPTNEELRAEAESDRYAIWKENKDYEFGDSQQERRWTLWVEQTERLLGHDLDGDQQEDGYSLDEANDLYNQPRMRGEARITPEQYAQKVRGNPVYKGGAK